jgi:hypothetical protein
LGDFGVFAQKERASFAPPEKLSPSQWVERYAYIPRKKPNSGEYHLARIQYIAAKRIGKAVSQNRIANITRFCRRRYIPGTLTGHAREGA